MREPEIIAETVDILAINKPAGLIVHSDGRTKEPSLAAWLIERYPYLASVGEPWISPQGESVLIGGLVHRLDRTTSGVLIVAKTQAMHEYLKKEFKERRVEKRYRAYVYGEILSEGKVIAEIMRSNDAPRRWYARPCEETDTRAAITEWKRLDVLKDAEETVSYIEAIPRTGRTHQLRVHFASIGHPIVADHLYAPERPALLGFKRPALHAYSISLTLPNGEQVIYAAPLPDDFAMK